MRILHLADRLSGRGGADWHLLGVLEAQAAQHEVRLAVGRNDGTVRAPCRTTTVPGLDSRTPAAAALDPLVWRFTPQVIHLHNVVNPSVLQWAAGRGAVITVQDHRFFCPGRGKWTAAGEVCRETMRPEVCAACFDDEAYFHDVLSLTVERLEALKRQRVVVLSSYMKRELEAAGVPGGRVAVIPPFVHGLDRHAVADGPPCALFVGRLAEAKGVWEAIEAWQRSEVELPLVLAGTGRLRSKIRVPGCEVLGWVPHDRISSLYRRAEVVVLPSRWQEPFGIAGLEALAMGTPVVAWDAGGVSEWHPGEGLVSWGDIDGLARALRGAIGRKIEPPVGFERDRLMNELYAWYRSNGPPNHYPRTTSSPMLRS